MKSLLPILGVVLLMFSFTLDSNQSILDLQKNKKIILNVKGNSSSTHYLNPLKAEIKNVSSKMLNIEVPAGLHFKSDDPGIQDIIITQSQVIAIAPGKSKSVDFSGVCIQSHNSSPNEDSKFTLSSYGEEPMWELAKFLDEKNIQSSQGQHAMWVLSDGEEPSYIIGFDVKNEMELLNKTLALAGLDKMPEEKIKELKQEVREPVYRSSLKGSFTMKFSSKKKVQIAVFNEDNVLMKEVLNEFVDAGNRRVEYQLETSDLGGKKIFTQLIADNKVWSRREINIPAR